MGQKTNKQRNKKPSRKSLVKALDTIVSLIVRARDQQCVNCGSRQNLTCGHLFSRTNYSTRWDLTNNNCQCAGCNLRHDHDPYPYQEWWKRKYGDKKYHTLYKVWSRTEKHHWSNLELTQLLDDLTSYYNRSIKSGDFPAYVPSLQLWVADSLQRDV